MATAATFVDNEVRFSEGPGLACAWCAHDLFENNLIAQAAHPLTLTLTVTLTLTITVTLALALTLTLTLTRRPTPSAARCSCRARAPRTSPSGATPSSTRPAAASQHVTPWPFRATPPPLP